MNDNKSTTIKFCNGVPMLPDAEIMKRKVAGIFSNKELSREKQNEKVCQYIIEQLLSFGSFDIHKKGIAETAWNFTYRLKTGEIYPISKKSALLSALIYHNYGITSVSKVYRFLVEVLKHASFMGNEIHVAGFSHYDSEKGILYFPKTHSQVIVCKKDGIETVPNGSYGVYLGNSGQFSPFEYLGQDFVSEHSAIERSLFANLNCPENNTQFLNAEEAAFILELIFYLIPFASSMETRPLLVFHGQRKSGKSSCLKRMGRALFGPDWNISLIPRSRRDLETEFANNILCFFDNVDRQLQKSQLDAFASVTTGGGYRSRRLYSDSTQNTYSPRPLIAIATRDPAFTAEDDDIVDRAIIVKLETLSTVIPENELVSEVINHRNEILTEMVNRMPSIITALQGDVPNGMNRSFRMADFANFSYKASYPIFRNRMTDKEITEMLERVFKKLVASQRSYVLSNPLHYAVDVYVQECINKKLTPLKIESHPLYIELLRIDKNFNLGFQKICKSLIAFGKLMTNNEKIFADRYGYSKKRGTGNKTEHTFTGIKQDYLEI